jgi:hypothetical protein
MTAQKLLLQTINALAHEINALVGYTDEELQTLADSIDLIHGFRSQIEIEASRREMSVSEFWNS